MTDTNTAAALSAEADGWIEWSGGENPVPEGDVHLRQRGYLDQDDQIFEADFQQWTVKDYDPQPWDIIAYRVATPAPAALEGSSPGEGEAWNRSVNLGYQSDEPTLREMVAHYYRSHSMPDPLTWADRYIAALQPSSAADAKPVAWQDRPIEADGHGGYRYAQPQPSQQAGAVPPEWTGQGADADFFAAPETEFSRAKTSQQAGAEG